MAVFAVVLNEAHPDVTKRLKETHPNHYRLNDTFFLVQGDALAETIAVSVGLKGDDRIETARGVVFRLNMAYAGYSVRSLWDWLGQAEERE